MYTHFSNVETKTTIKKDQRRTKMEQNTYWYLLVVSSDSRAYTIGIHSSGIKIDWIKSSNSWVKEQASLRA